MYMYNYTCKIAVISSLVGHSIITRVQLDSDYIRTATNTVAGNKITYKRAKRLERADEIRLLGAVQLLI